VFVLPKSAQAHMEDFFYREFIKYFKLAEEKRRWNLFNDIRWDEANPNTRKPWRSAWRLLRGRDVPARLHLEDAAHDPPQRGRAWFHVNWATRNRNTR
jgi:hypothetical protein